MRFPVLPAAEVQRLLRSTFSIPVSRIAILSLSPPELDGRLIVNTSMHVVFGILFGVGYLVSPVMLIWGWARWSRRPQSRTILPLLSLIGFIFASASALLAVSSMAYAQIHPFPYYDPLLLRIFRAGVLLSLAGVGFGISGVWRASPLRWHAPTSALAPFVFWIMTASGE
jgi:hypothetical protein